MTDILNKFKNQLILFLDELIAQFPMEGDLVVARIFISTQMPIQEIVNGFNHHMNKNNNELKKMVSDRNECFFLNHNVFGLISKDKVNHFKKLWRSGSLDKSDKKIIWAWVDTFIYLGEKYIMTQRDMT